MRGRSHRKALAFKPQERGRMTAPEPGLVTQVTWNLWRSQNMLSLGQTCIFKPWTYTNIKIKHQDKRHKTGETIQQLENLLLFQKTHIWFPAPTLGNSQLTNVTSVQGDPAPSSGFHRNLCIHDRLTENTQIHINKQIILKSGGVCLF